MISAVYKCICSVFQTPPQTPTSMDNNMEDVQINDAKQDSSCDMLQNIINIKNESNPVSLNTVQVSWLHPVANSDSDQYQEIARAQPFSPPQKYQTFQTNNQSQIQEIPQAYQFSSTQLQDLPQHYSQNSLLEYRPHSVSSQSSDYQQNVFESQELQYCSTQSFADLLNDTEGLDNLSAALCQPLPVGHQQPDISSHPQNCSLLPNNTCSQLENQGLSLTPSDISSQQQSIAGNTAQLGKSFFQWQVEQEENKLASISQDQILAKDSDGDT